MEKLDLTRMEDVVAYMDEATKTKEWNYRCDCVKSANGGDYPSFWWDNVRRCSALIIAQIYGN